MRQSLLINVLRLLKARENNALTLWNQAKPISLDELDARLTALTSSSLNEKSNPCPTGFGNESFEELLAQLEKMWEQLEDLDDCIVV